MTWLKQEAIYWLWCRWVGHERWGYWMDEYIRRRRAPVRVRVCNACHRVHPEDVDRALDAFEADIADLQEGSP